MTSPWTVRLLLTVAALSAPASSLASTGESPGIAAPSRPPTQAPPAVRPAPLAAATEELAQVPDGQWGFTSQYGWVWMPYAAQYASVPEYGEPLLYVFRPGIGWEWVVAPWILDRGPTPYWGPAGTSRFAWYSKPWLPVNATFLGGRPIRFHDAAVRTDRTFFARVELREATQGRHGARFVASERL